MFYFLFLSLLLYGLWRFYLPPQHDWWRLYLLLLNKSKRPHLPHDARSKCTILRDAHIKTQNRRQSYKKKINYANFWGKKMQN